MKHAGELFMRYYLIQGKRLIDAYGKDEVTVYAAQASFFIALSSFPFLMILLTVIQLIPAVTQQDLLLVLSRAVPSGTYVLVETIIESLETQATAAVLSVTSIATIWSASRGMLGIERGLNRIAGCSRRQGYIKSRLINSCYTVVFLLVCILSLLLMVFGNSIQRFLIRVIPLLGELTAYFLLLRIASALAVLILFFAVLYTWLPMIHQPIRRQLPGALFSTVAWIVLSFGFSIYFNYFSRFSYTYGSLTAVVILMLWLYFCICALFLGAEINQFLLFYTERRENMDGNNDSFHKEKTQ